MACVIKRRFLHGTKGQNTGRPAEIAGGKRLCEHFKSRKCKYGKKCRIIPLSLYILVQVLTKIKNIDHISGLKFIYNDFNKSSKPLKTDRTIIKDDVPTKTPTKAVMLRKLINVFFFEKKYRFAMNKDKFIFGYLLEYLAPKEFFQCLRLYVLIYLI